jgi:hypothetical protein
MTNDQQYFSLLAILLLYIIYICMRKKVRQGDAFFERTLLPKNEEQGREPLKNINRPLRT